MLNAVFIVLGFVGWCIRWTAAAVVFLIVVAASGYFVYTEALEPDDTVVVPNILDLPITEASSLIAEAGLDIGKQIQAPHDVVPKYHVIAQRPPAGHVVRVGRQITPTVSLGADSEMAPDLLRKSRKEAEREIKSARFRLGAVSRIVDNAPRDTVLAQDPPAGTNVPRHADISLLLSAGDQQDGAFMPDIQDKPVREINSILAPFRVYLKPNIVDMPNAPTDVVLNQSPPPNTLIQPDTVVTYDVMPSGNITLPTDIYRTEVRHRMLFDYHDKEVRIDVVDHEGNRETMQKYTPSFEEEARQTRVAGSRIRIVVPYVGEATVEIYVDGELVQSYYLSEGAKPVPENA
ncbi:MAG: PASTA domain-containing protein [Candidatus Hydrogenedentota bacterium]